MPRLVTLSGVGGVGKTRLASEVAARRTTAMARGSWNLVRSATRWRPVTPSLPFSESRNSPAKTIEQSIIAALNGQRLLVVLDNCEHLIDAVASLAQQVIRHAADHRSCYKPRSVDGRRRAHLASPIVEFPRWRSLASGGAVRGARPRGGAGLRVEPRRRYRERDLPAARRHPAGN